MADVQDRTSETSIDHKLEARISEKHTAEDVEVLRRSDESEQEATEQEYPEGGRDAYLTVLGAFLINFVELGMTSVTGALQAEYSTNQLKNKTQSEVAWIGTFQLFVTIFLGAFVGRTFDSIGPAILIAVGALLITFALMMMSLCKDYYQFFLTQGLILGAGSAMVYGPAMVCVTHWFNKKRATMTSIASSGAAVGSVVLPLVLNNLLLTVGFAWALRIIGFISLVLLAPAVFMVKARLPPREFTGLDSLVDFGGLRDVRYVLVCVGSVMMGLGLYNPFFYSQIFAEVRGYPLNITTYILSIINAGTVVGRLISGVAADRLGPLNVISFWCFVLAITIICWIFVESAAGFVVWAIAYGIFSAAYVPLIFPSIAQFTKDMSKFGGRAGLCSAIESFASLVSAPTAGALLDVVHGRFDRMIIFSAVVCLAGSLFLAAARIAGTRKVFVKY